MRRSAPAAPCAATRACVGPIVGLVVVVAASVLTPAPAGADAVRYRPPVDAPVVDPFRPPPVPWGSGNRGLEYETVPGTVILATAADPRIKALANLAAAETNPSAIAAMPNVQAPYALIAGSRDTITPPNTNQLPMYNNGSAPRQLPNITGGFHCGFVDNTFSGCDSGTISRADQLLETRRQLTAFFDLYLKKDQTNWNQVWGLDMRGNPRVQTTFDAGVLVTPESQTRMIPRGSRTTYELTITNTGRGPDTYAIQISGNRWPMILLNPSTPTLQVGETAVVRVAFTGFVAGGGATQDTVVVSARSARDGVTRAIGTATTQFE